MIAQDKDKEANGSTDGSSGANSPNLDQITSKPSIRHEGSMADSSMSADRSSEQPQSMVPTIKLHSAFQMEEPLSLEEDRSYNSSGSRNSEMIGKSKSPQTVGNIQDLLKKLNIVPDKQNTFKIGGQEFKLSTYEPFSASESKVMEQKNSFETHYTGDLDLSMVKHNKQCSVSDISDKTRTSQIGQPQPSPGTAIDMNKINDLFQQITPGDEYDALMFQGLDFDKSDDTRNKSQQPNQIQEYSGNLLTQSIHTPSGFINSPPSIGHKDNHGGNHERPYLQKHYSEMPQQRQFVLSQSIYQNLPALPSQNSYQHQQMQQQMNVLKSQLQERNQELNKLKSTLSQVTQYIAKVYSSPELLSNDFEDKELMKVLSQGFVAQAKLHLAFLFSSPLILKYKDQESKLSSKTMMNIDHAKEFCQVQESLKQTGNQIRYRKIPATLDNLTVCLTEGPCALHFSGHGVENCRANFGKDSLLLKNEGNFLIFEDSEGCAQYMSEKRLHELLEASGTKLEFVFVSSCYSQFAGEIFHNAGAKHVICVKRGERILDDASIIFGKAFYHALFSQTVTVCSAFNIAKAHILSYKDKDIANEGHKFILLKDTDEVFTQSQSNSIVQYVATKPNKKHKCTVFGPFNKGQIENVATEPLFRLEVSKIEDFIGRRKEMQEVISYVMNNRLVTIKGIPGIGKTTLARAVAFYLDERYAFKDGILLITLRGLDQANMFLTRLNLLVSQHIPQLEKDKEEKVLEDVNNIQQRIISCLKDKEILLVLDNVEDPIREEGLAFREYLSNLLCRIPRLKILLTSRIPVGSMADVSEKIFFLKELTPQYAMELLIQKAMRQISHAEVEELLKSAEPVRKHNDNPLRTGQGNVNLNEHHMFYLLAGHPHAISLAAPMLQDRSLKELYSLLNSNDIMDWLRIEGISGTPLASLKVSLDTSIRHMEQTEPQAIRLFCLIGLLPGGVTDEILDQLWGDGWMKYSEKLLRASLVVKKTYPNNEIKYNLLPFMNKYAEDLMDEESRMNMHRKCCQYLANICKDLLKLNANFKLTTSQNINEVMNRLVQFETNIWAAIYRMIDKRQEASLEQSRLGGSITRAKSPANHNYQHSSNSNEGHPINKSQDDSSNGGSSNERQGDPYILEDDYDKILCSRRENGKRSMSERSKIMRSLIENEENQSSRILEEEEFEEETKSEDVEPQTDLSTSNKKAQQDIQKELGFSSDEDRIIRQRYFGRLSYAKPSNLIQSQDDPRRGEDSFQNKLALSAGNDTSSQVESCNEIEHVYPTEQCAFLLSDDQGNIASATPCFSKRKRELKPKFEEITADIEISNAESDFDEDAMYNNAPEPSISTNQSLQLVDAALDNFQQLLRNNSLDNTLPKNNTSLHISSMSTERPLGMSSQVRPGSSASTKKVRLGVESNASSIGLHQDENSSVDSIEQQLNAQSNFDYHENQYAMKINTQQRRKSALIVKNNTLAQVEEKAEESHDASFNMGDGYKDSDIEKNDQLFFQTDINEAGTPHLHKRISSKKFQEDVIDKDTSYEEQQKEKPCCEILCCCDAPSIQYQEGYERDETSGKEKSLEKTTKLKKNKQKKRVTYQLTADEQSAEDSHFLQVPGSHRDDPKRQSVTLTKQNGQISQFSPEGSLLVYYISNLVLLYKYADANKAIEQFGLKLADPLCKANLKKLQGLILFIHSLDFKESMKKFQESYKLFKDLDLYLGQAICNCAMGYLLFIKSEYFIDKTLNENQVFLKAKKKMEDAVSLYQKINHQVGEAYCHKILAHIKQKLNKNHKNHFHQQRILMKKDSDLQKENKSNFIQRCQGMEVSLFIEVVGGHQEQIAFITNKEKELHLTSHPAKSQIKPPTVFQKPQSFDKTVPYTNIQNVKNSKPPVKSILKGEERKSQPKDLEEIKEYNPPIRSSFAGARRTQQEIKREAPVTNKKFNTSMSKKDLIKPAVQAESHAAVAQENEVKPEASKTHSQKNVKEYIKNKWKQTQDYVRQRKAQIKQAHSQQMSASFLSTPSHADLNASSLLSKKPKIKKTEAPNRKDSDKKPVMLQEDDHIFEQASDCSSNNSFDRESVSTNNNRGSMTGWKDEHSIGKKRLGSTIQGISKNQERSSTFSEKGKVSSKNNTQSKVKKYLEGAQIEPSKQKTTQSKQIKTESASPQRPQSPNQIRRPSVQHPQQTSHTVTLNLVATVTFEGDVSSIAYQQEDIHLGATTPPQQ